MERDERQVVERPRGRPGRTRLERSLWAAGLALALVALGVAAGVWGERRLSSGSSTTGKVAAGGAAPGAMPMPQASGSAAAPATDPPAEVEIELTGDALARAGIKTTTVNAVGSSASVRVPGTVMANAYREVKITPIVGGIVRAVPVALGDSVRRGAPVITLFSAELADAQTKYLSMAAMLEADHRKLDRTRQLVEIGAASRQELEDVTATDASHATEVESARQWLLQIGLTPEQVQALKSPSQIASTVVVPAPIDGVITGRTVNLGQVVSMGQELLVVTDIYNVWVLGDLYEQDFQTVRVGSEAMITPSAYPGLTLRGRVTYIDPRLDPQARTAKVRVEVPNPDGRLRLGMYVSMVFTTPGKNRILVVPRTAVQALGERLVVYLPVKDEEGKFLQREIRVGALMGDSYAVLSGLQPGEIVVTEGSFFLRAESVRNAPSG